MSLLLSPVVTIVAGQNDSPVIDIREGFIPVALIVYNAFNSSSSVGFKISLEDSITGAETYYVYQTDEASPTRVGWLAKVYAAGYWVLNFNVYPKPAVPNGKVKLTLSAVQAADTRIQFAYTSVKELT